MGRLRQLFASGDYADPAFAVSVRRHSILHGGFKAYGELESLRLFFLLELLHDAVGRYKERVWLVGAARDELTSLFARWKTGDPALGTTRVAAPDVSVGARLWIARYGGEAAGFAALEADEVRGLGRLTFFVAPPFRGRGVGAKVARLAIEEARVMDLPGVMVEVDRVGCEDGAAARCLARAGFSSPDGAKWAYLVWFDATNSAR